MKIIALEAITGTLPVLTKITIQMIPVSTLKKSC